MNRGQIMRLGAYLGGLLVALCMTSPVMAQYPSLPTGSNGNASYEWRPDLGGWRDRSANIVWGYCTIFHINLTDNYFTAQDRARNYAQQMAQAVTDRLQRAATAESQAALETDPVRKQLRLNTAERLRQEAEAFRLASIDAAKYTNWRVPSLAEFQAAYRKGLFSTGTTGFNFDAAPIPGYQPLNRVFYWTSNLSSNRRQAIVFHLGDGGSGWTSATNSFHYVLVVRTTNADEVGAGTGGN